MQLSLPSVRAAAAAGVAAASQRQHYGLTSCTSKPRVPAARSRRLPPARVLSAGGDTRTARSNAAPPAPPSPFQLAAERLSTVLRDAALSNKDTVLVDFVDACSPEERCTLFTNLGSLTLLAAFLSTWLFGGLDPLGGMRWSTDSLDAALLGVAYAAPLVACSVAARSPLFREAFPVLSEMHEAQHGIACHLKAGMSGVQVAILLGFATFPSLCFLLPSCKAATIWLGAFVQSALLQPFGDALSVPALHLGPLGLVMPAVVSSYVAGIAAASCFNVRPLELTLLRDAVKNAERYFRLRVAERSSPSPMPPASQAFGPPAVFASATLLGSFAEGAETAEEECSASGRGCSGEEAADAFRAVAMVWLIGRRRVARLAFMLAQLQVCYLCVIWTASGDLSTPLAAAVLHAAAELWLGDAELGKQPRSL